MTELDPDDVSLLSGPRLPLSGLLHQSPLAKLDPTNVSLPLRLPLSGPLHRSLLAELDPTNVSLPPRILLPGSLHQPALAELNPATVPLLPQRRWVSVDSTASFQREYRF